MSHSVGSRSEVQKQGGEKPAIGVVYTGDNDDEVARICLRAGANGHDVLITHQGSEPELPELTELPGVRIIPPEGDQAEVKQGGRDRLAAAARGLSAPGVIFVRNTSASIHFQKSLEEADDGDYVTEAVSETAGDIDTLVGIPAYNEEGSISEVVKKASKFADEVLVVDDGSDDQTAALAKSAGAHVVEHPRNRGYGAALKTAFETADSWDVDCLVIIDGDGQHDATDIPILEEKVLKENASVAIGSRFSGDSNGEIPLYRRFGIGIINVMSNLSMGAMNPESWVSDTQSGFRAYDPQAIETLADADLGDDMDASLDILYHLHEEGYSIKETPTVVDYEVENGHSQNPIAHGVSLVSTILRTVEREHPVKFLGVPGVLMALVGAGFGYATMANYLTTQSFPLGLALASVFFILLGVFSGFTAIMLHSLSAHFND